MQLSLVLTEQDIVSDLRAATKEELLTELAEHLARRADGVDARTIRDLLETREQIQSTAIEDGIAIPHAKSPAVTEPVCCLARSTKGIPFGAPDGKPSHLFFAVIAPEQDLAAHLRLLARVSRLFGSWEHRQRLMEAKDAHEMHLVLRDSDKHEAEA